MTLIPLTDLTSRSVSVAVIGLGYVGLPLAVCLASASTLADA